MRFLFFLMFICFPIFSQAQNDELKNKIIWDEGRPLKWGDFKGRPDEESKFYALTRSGIYYHVRQKSETEYFIFVETFFDPYGSWQKEKQVTDYLLIHEQRHFDIHELYSRFLVKSLREMEYSDDDRVFGKIRETYMKVSKDAQVLSDLYDKETVHSTNEEQQQVWNNKIHKMLADTKEFDLKEITLELRYD